MINKEEIKEIALQCGFKLKQQPDGTMDLNPYVYDFARTLLPYHQLTIKALEEKITDLQRDAERYRWLREDDNWVDDEGEAWEKLGQKSNSEFDKFIDTVMLGDNK